MCVMKGQVCLSHSEEVLPGCSVICLGHSPKSSARVCVCFGKERVSHQMMAEVGH